MNTGDIGMANCEGLQARAKWVAVASLRRGACSSQIALISLMLFCSTVLRAETPAGTQPSASVPAPAYLEDQAIDQELGVINHAWTVNRVRVSSRFDLPAQLAPGGLPPFAQQVETAQSAGGPLGP